MNVHRGLTEEDRLFLSRAEDCARAAERYKTPRFTKFISPHERAVFERAADISPFVQPIIWGGADECERCVIGFFPDYIEPEKSVFPIKALRLRTGGELGHREVLGSVLGLGIERTLLGDIFPEPEGAVLMCLDSIADYIRINLSRVGSARVSVEETELSTLTLAPKRVREVSAVVASLRLDSVLGHAVGKSRAKAQELIRAGLVQLNFMTEEDPSADVSEGDVFSVRGIGRMKLLSVQGETKKGRIRITVQQYI